MRTRAIRLHVPALLVAAAAVWTGAICGGEESDDGPPLPATTPFSDDLTEKLHTIRDRAAELRKLNVNPDIGEGSLSRDQLRDWAELYDASLTDDERKEIETSNTAFRLLHFIGPDDDLLELSKTTLSEGYAGFYQLDEDTLILIEHDGTIDPDDEVTLAHEYVHSFQDGHFDFRRLDRLIAKERDDSRSEYDVTIDCLIEGDASLADTIYTYEVLGDGAFDQGEPPASEPEDEENPFEDYPPALLRYGGFNYSECPMFVAALYGPTLSWVPVNRAYDNPPWTTEQILHPEKYLDREGATGMSPIDLRDKLGDRWERQEGGGIFGEFDLYNYLLTITNDEPAARSAAAGWGVGWVYVYVEKETEEDPEREVAVHLALEFDTPEDFAEFGLVYSRVIEVVSKGNVTAGEGLRPTCWSVDGEYGYFTWGDSLKRFDVVIATSEDARDALTQGSLSAPTNGPCPE
jgi:hypothetical protein